MTVDLSEDLQKIADYVDDAPTPEERARRMAAMRTSIGKALDVVNEKINDQYKALCAAIEVGVTLRHQADELFRRLEHPCQVIVLDLE